MKTRLVSTCAVAFLTLLLMFGSVIQTPAVEAANNSQSTEKVVKTETKTKTLETNAIIDAKELEIAKNRAILIDEAKKQAQSSVKEQEELIEQKKIEEAMETESYDYSYETDTKKSSSASSKSTSSYEYDDDDTTSSSGSTYVAGSSNAGYLMSIKNPDPSYTSYSISLSDSDRAAAERIIMGEAGSMGYNGMALVAQCLRDAYVTHGYSSISETISSYGYYASMSQTPSSTCKEVVRYIFDQGGAAVQHRILVFYASDVCSSSWHESQNYIVSCGSVRFFDRW